MVFLSKGLDSWWVRVLLPVLFLALVYRPLSRRGAMVAFLLWPIANFLTDVAKDLFPFGRPGNELADAITRVGMSQSMGTASAHSANMMFIGVALTYYFKWRGTPALMIAVLVGLSRVYVGAHYPSQVLLGWTIGAVAAFLAIVVVELTIKARQERRSPDLLAEGPEPLSEEL